MNEIYKAIEHFEHLQKRYTTQHNGKHCELVKTALAALREKTEREKGCDECQPSCHNCKHDVYDDFCQYYGKQGCGNLLHEPKHKYCPMCGKRLEVEHGE